MLLSTTYMGVIMKELYKKIPQVSKLLDDEEIIKYFEKFYQAEIKETIEKVL